MSGDPVVASQTWWYVARSGGIVAWTALAASTFWGVALSSRFLGKKPKPNWMLDLHRFLGGLAVVFTAIHIFALVADSYVTITIVNIVVPFTGNYHVTDVAWGIVAMYLLTAIEITSLLRRRLSKQIWRTIHYLSFPLFLISTVHLLLIGTDRTTLPLRLGVLLVVATVCIATFIRIVQADSRPSRITRPAGIPPTSDTP